MASQSSQRLTPGTLEYLDAMQRGEIPVMSEFRRKKKLTEAELREQLLEERRDLSWYNPDRYNVFGAVADQLE